MPGARDAAPGSWRPACLCLQDTSDTMGDEDWEAEIITPHLSSYVPVLEKVGAGPRASWSCPGCAGRSARRPALPLA